MTLKLKILRTVSFAMKEFGFEHCHFFTLLHQAIEDEALQIERSLLEKQKHKSVTNNKTVV